MNAIKKPGQIPHVYPISVKELAEPNSGGCDVSTEAQRSAKHEFHTVHSPTRPPRMNIPGTPIARSLKDRSLKKIAIR